MNDVPELDHDPVVRYRAGDGIVVRHGDTCILLAPALAPRAADVYAAMRRGDDPMAGLGADDGGVAVIGTAKSATTFIARGPGMHWRITTPKRDVTGLPELRAGWHGGAVAAVQGWRVSLDESPAAGPVFELVSGCAPAGEVEWGEVSEPELDAGEDADAPAAAPDAARPVAASDADEAAGTPTTGAAPRGASDEAAPAAAPYDLDDTVLDAPVAAPPAPSPVVPAGAPPVGAPPAPAPHATPIAFSSPPASAPAAPPTAPPAVPPTAAPPAAAPPAPAVSDVDDETVHDEAPPPPAAPAELPREAAPFAPQLLSNQGHVVPITGSIVIGRRPSADRAPDPSSAQTLAVRSPREEISRSHCIVAFDAGSVLVWDLGSSNGTLVLRGGAIAEPLTPQVPVVLARGDVLDLGDGASFRLG